MTTPTAEPATASAAAHAPELELAPRDRRALLDLARNAIAAAVDGRSPAAPLRRDWPAALWRETATFVTLERDDQLRGCRGVLEPVRVLPEDVAVNAVDTALADPRFPPVRAEELHALTVSLSVLTPRRPLAARDHADLEGRLVPHHDGLVVALGPRRATFLPKVWEQLPEPAAFLHQLWLKAGLPPGSWHPELRVWRYGALAFGESDFA